MVFTPLEKVLPSPPSSRPLLVMVIFMFAVFGVALARLFELTVIYGQEYRDRADKNRILVRPLPAPRGAILDRSGEALTRNVPSVREIDFPGDNLGPVPIEEPARFYPFGPALAHSVGYVGEVSQEELQNCPSGPSNSFCPSSGDIIGKTGLEKQYDSFLRGAAGAQLIEVDANGKTLRILSEQQPTPGRNLKTNLDANLSQISLSALSGKKGAVAAIDPVDGSILALVSSPSFDPNLFQNNQKTRMAGESDIPGESEKSDIRPSDFPTVRPSDSPSFPSVLEILSDKANLPLFNRVVSGEYPPGSIFKLVTAAAGLTENKIQASTLIEDTGEIRVGNFRYGNWYFDQYGRTEGAIGVSRALARSNDIFFYRVGEWLGPQTLADWARRLGLGQKTRVDLPAEADGLVPDPDWKERQIGEKWYLGNTYHMAIGQGDVRVTPLQVAVMTSAVITGQKCRPHIFQNTDILGGSERSDIWFSDFPSLVSFPNINHVYAADKSECEDTGLSDETRNLILSGMVGACSAGGTAFPFFDWNTGTKGSTFVGNSAVACKTGTAQHGGAKTNPHAWVVVVGPIKTDVEGSTSRRKVEPLDLDLDSPKRIVLVVLVEESGEGSYVAAPIAKQILSQWFSP